MFACTRREAFLSVFFLFLTFVVFITTYHRETIHENLGPLKYVLPQLQTASVDIKSACIGEEKLMQDRIRISKILNSMKQNFSKQSCEMLELQKKAGQNVSIAMRICNNMLLCIRRFEFPQNIFQQGSEM